MGGLDLDEHGATHWGLSTNCENFSSLVDSQWIQHENQYLGEDKLIERDLRTIELPELQPQSNYCIRFRYRDRSLGWSEWSTPAAFATGQQ